MMPEYPVKFTFTATPKTGDVCPHGSLRRSCEVCERDERIAELEAATENLSRVCNLLEGICEEFERAIAEAENRASGRKGMQVPCHCDFVSAIQFPSVVVKMRWWVREFRAALKGRG